MFNILDGEDLIIDFIANGSEDQLQSFRGGRSRPKAQFQM